MYIRSAYSPKWHRGWRVAPAGACSPFFHDRPRTPPSRTNIGVSQRRRGRFGEIGRSASSSARTWGDRGGQAVTVRDVLHSCMRRWPFFLVGLLLTLGAVGYVQTAPGVYWARTKVILLGPPVDARPNKLDSSSAGLIATAGLIAREMNASRTFIPSTSPDVTIVDQGVYDGEVVRVPDYGGQWASNFTDPVLDIQASARDPRTVQQRVESMVAEAQSILQRRQHDAMVAPGNRITVAVSPVRVQVHYGGGDRRRGGAAALALGFCLSVAAATAVDLRLR